MYLKISMSVGKYGGPVKNDSLPWKTIIDYVKVTQGNSVVFIDDFDTADTVQAAPSILITPAPPRFSIRTALRKALAHWPMVSLIVCLGIGLALTALKFLRAKPNRQKTE